MSDMSWTPRKTPMAAPQSAQEWAEKLADPWWRLTSGVLYKIMIKGDDDAEGHVAPFLPNINQLRFLAGMHDRNVILKARQLGFTTEAAIRALDHSLFVPDQRCGIIAHDLETAASILRDKVKFAYANLPAPLRTAMPLERESAKELLFAHNNSSIRVATSMRGSTIHMLHISEMGKIARRAPDKAREIVTGALPAVPKSGVATIESTAEGQEGEFYEIATRAENTAKSGMAPAPGQWKFHFFPWYMEPGYEADPAGVAISPKQHEYFAGIEKQMGVTITPRQRAWYVTKLENDFSGDVHKMWQEMPSTPAECWSKSTEGTYFTPQLDRARNEGRITKVPHREGLPVYTFWDIGAGDGTGIWMMQQVGLAAHFIRYIEGWGLGYAHYVAELRKTGFIFGGHYLPHDANHERQLVNKVGAPITMLQDLAPDWRFNIVPRAHDFTAAVNLLRGKFSEAWFDEEGCKEGLLHLSLYRKKYNTRLGAYTEEPEKHDGHSEAADALRQWAQGFDPAFHTTSAQKRKPRRASGWGA